jgi:hypothetical protein
MILKKRTAPLCHIYPVLPPLVRILSYNTINTTTIDTTP